MAGTLDNNQTEEALAAHTAVDGSATATNGASPAEAPAPPLAPPETLPSAPDDASRLCVNCAALLEEGQDWCLECGTAQPGRIGSKPGWRPALTVVLLTAVLAAGAVAAAYAALSSDAERQANAAAPPSAQPIVPPAPVQSVPPPAEETPEVKAPESKVDTPKPSPAPQSDAPDPAPAPAPAPSTPAPAGDTGGDDATEDEGTGDDAGADVKPEPKIVALSPDAASTYDPFDRAGGLTGDPADAIDGRARTKWEAPVGGDGFVNIGLLVSLEQAEAFEKVRLQAGTPGFTVELYGSKRGTAPEGDPAQTTAWEKLDTTRDFGTDEKLDVGKGKWRYVLLWFTEQPADTKVMIPEVSLLK
ncbi:MAG TPA: hypothetical protein VF587_20710 [Solirubrobacteraceae bacterium]|jgi:hypothetical protein